MSRTIPTMAALVMAAVLLALAPAGAAERRADGLRSDAAPTEFSSYHRRWHRRGYWGRRAVWGPRYRWGVRSAYWGGPGYAAWGPGYGYWRPRYAYAGWGWPYRPFWRPRPFFGIGIGFGPRWWW